MVFILPDPNVKATLTNYSFCYGNSKLVTVCKRVINSVSCVVGRTGGSCARKSLLAAWSSRPRGFVALTTGKKLFWARLNLSGLTRWFGAGVTPFAGVCFMFGRTLIISPYLIAHALRGGERLWFVAFCLLGGLTLFPKHVEILFAAGLLICSCVS